MERMRWLSLHGCQVLLIIFLIKAGFLASAQTDGETFLRGKEQQAANVVSSALANYADACGLLANCTGSDTCSQSACNPTRNNFQESRCVEVANNTQCSCPTVQADYMRSYVRVPMLGDGTNINPESVTSICSQRKLDEVFIGFPPNSPYYSFYFGAVDGSFRLFPGTAVESCDTYDPRLRPWYVGAISVVKDLVVLVDVASTMGTTIGFFESFTPIQSAIGMTKTLLGTLTKSDRVTVTAYGSTVHPDQGSQYSVRGEVVDPNESQFVQLLNNVGNFTPSTESGSSNTSAAIAYALQVLGNGSPNGALKVIVLFTDGKSPIALQEVADLVAQLNLNHITAFIYQINESDPGLVNLTCSLTQGQSEQLQLDPLKNPPYTLKSYFSFLAGARALSSGPYFWQQPYQDYNFLGRVITVASAAISPTGDLVGVAGIDVQVSDGAIDSLLLQQITTALLTRTTSPPTIVSVPKLSPCNLGTNNGSLECTTTISNDALCEPDGNQLSFVQRLCCSGCGGYEAPKSNKNTKWIILGAVVGGVVLVSVVLSISGCCCRKGFTKRIPVRPPRSPPPSDPPPPVKF